MLCRLKRGIPLANTHWINVVVSGFRLCCYFNRVRVFVKPWSVLLRRQNDIERGIWYGGNKGGNSYSPWCIASYYILKLPNARDAISSTGTWKLNSSGKRLVLSIKLSVPLLCRSIYDFCFTIPNISLVKSKRVFCPPIELTRLTIAPQSTQMFLDASKEGLCLTVRPVLKCVDKALHGLTSDFHDLSWNKYIF